MRLHLSLVAALAMCVCSAGAFGADMVDNPQYTSWAKYKPGTSVTLKQSMEGAAMQGMKMDSKVTQKLVKVEATAATVEMTIEMSVSGRGMPPQSRQITIPAKVEKGQENMPASMNGAKAEVKDMKDGKEMVDVKGKKVEAQTKEFTVATTPAPAGRGADAGGDAMGPSTMHMKTWMAPEVPGGLVKMEQTGTMAPMGEMKMSMELVDYTVVQ